MRAGLYTIMMKVHVATYGCSANQSSSEIMMAAIRNMGHELVEEADAEVVVCNTCTVKAATEQKILHQIHKLGQQGVEVVVAGCMPQVQLDTILQRNPDAHILGVNSIGHIGDMLHTIGQMRTGDMPDDRLQTMDDLPTGFLNMARQRFNPNIHICQISQGCNYHCAYCIVTIARGKLRSFDADSIVADIRSAVEEGCGEIWLTSQDNAQYGTDGDVRLPELLEKIVSIPGDYKVRVGMMNPFSVRPILDNLLDVFESDKIYKIVHLPIQSASDTVLDRMDRYHSISEVNHIIDRFRQRYHDLTLFTDVIVAFPGETDEDFKQTLKWVEQYQPDKVNISRYTPRPLTKAREYRNIDSRIVGQRSGELHRLCDAIKLENKKTMIGWKGRVFVSKNASVRGVMARTDSYRPVVIPQSEGLCPGQHCMVEITDTTPGYFLGKVI